MKPEYLLLIPVLLLGVLLQFTPLITRRGIFFGATVDPDFPRSDDGRRLLLSYRLQVALWTVMAIVISLLLFVSQPTLAMLAPMLLLIVGGCVSYWLKFRKVHEHFGRRVPEIRGAELSPQPQPRPLSLWLCIPPFVWLAGVAFYLQSHWSQLPERFPVHWGVDGQPNGFATRSFEGVYGPILLAAFMNVFFLLLAMALLRASRNTTMRHVTVTVLLLLMYPVSFAFGMVGLLPLTTFPIWLVPVVTLASVAVLIVWSIMKITAHTATDAVPEPQNDSYWKAGMFYYNPDDPAIFVSKRVGIGYTVNFANKVSWLVMLGILLIALLPALLLRPR
jgi:uncharacterized membrane protein